MTILEFIEKLTSKGYCTFTFNQAKRSLDASNAAIRAAVGRLKQKGVLAQPLHGFYVIIPPEYRIIGCRPADHFINELMVYIGAPYYAGLLTAAQYYSAAHHRPQQYQVITNQKRRAIICGKVKIVFITKNSIKDIPTQQIKTSHSFIPASTSEATAMDLVMYPNRSGGLDNVLTVLIDLVEMMDAKKLTKLALETKEITWVQRLGYLLDLIDAKNLSDPLAEIVKKQDVHFRQLMLIKKSKIISHNFCSTSPQLILNKPIKNNKWKLIINKKLEPDA